MYQKWENIEAVTISGKTFCITNPEGGELTSTIIIANDIMIDVTDSYNVHKFLKMLLITEVMRRELRHLTARARSFQSLPSGTQGRGQLTRVFAQPKHGRRHTVHRKWAPARVVAPTISRFQKKSLYSHLQKQTALHFPRGHQKATVIRPLRGRPQPHALLIRHFTQLGREHNYENTNRRGLVGAKAPTT